MIEVELPDGSIAEFPDGTPDAVIEGVLKEQFAPKTQGGVMDTVADVGGQAVKGLAQGAAGLAAMPAHLGNWLGGWATKGIDAALGLEPRQMPQGWDTFGDLPGKVDAAIPIGEARTTPGRYANRVAQFAAGLPIGGPSGMAGKAIGAASGAVASQAASDLTKGSALQPYAEFTAGLAGGLAPSALRRAVTPFPISPERQGLVNTLKSEGVDLTAGQKTGRKGIQYAESEIGGGATANIMEKQGEQFTAAALKRAGTKSNRATPDVIDDTFNRIGGNMSALAQRNSLPTDPGLAQDVASIAQRYVSDVAQTARAPVVQSFANDAMNMAAQGATGTQYQKLYSALRKRARDAGDPDVRTALNNLAEALDDSMERSLAARNSPDLGKWRESRRQYRNLMVLEQASTAAGANAAEGLISPSALRNATIQKQTRRNYARGKGDFADLARAGEATMKPLPQSGTAPRLAARGFQSLPAIAGTMMGGQAGGEYALLGGMLGSMFSPIMGNVLMSRPVQGYLGNQLMRLPASTLGQRVAVPAIGGSQGLLGN